MAAGSNKGFLVFIGRYFIDGFNYLVDLTTMMFVSIKSFLVLEKGKKKVTDEIMYRKIYLSIRNTSGIIGLVSFIFGALIVIQISSLNVRMDVIGKIFETVIIKELGPLFTAIILAGRSATFITTEIGAMKKTQELMAFEVMGIEPDNYVMMPRVIGVTFSVFVLTFLFDICCIGGGLATTLTIGNISTTFYLQSILSQMTFLVILGTILKAVVSGLLLTCISCYHGFAIKGSFVELPPQVAKSFVSSLFFCFLGNFCISYLLYL